MTDERMGDALWPAIDRLPRGAGIIVRHYGLSASARDSLFRRIRAVARRRSIRVLLAGSLQDAVRLRADGVHGRHARAGRLITTRPVHNRRELVAAARAGVDLAFVSPLFETRSHPGVKALGRARFGLMIRNSPVPVIALGGMDARRARSLSAAGSAMGIYGWAAIDAWSATGTRRLRT
jgi:thiamine-phosphate pyrophosphorylase